jgi:hypothetical protein
LGILDEIAVNKSLSFRRQFIGRVLPAITLSEEETQEESAVLTDNYIPVRIRGQSVPPNKLVDICVEDVQPGRTYARLFSPLF